MTIPLEITVNKSSYVIGEKIKVKMKITDTALSKGDLVSASIRVTTRDGGLIFTSDHISATPNTITYHEIGLNPALYRIGAYRITVENANEKSSVVFHIIRSIPTVETLTIAFWDLSGFSKLSHTMKARNDLIFDFLIDYFGLAGDIISKHQGVIDKFIGDGIMSLFGLRSVDEDEAESAINAIGVALKIRESFESEVWEKWKKRLQSHAEESIRDVGIKCGINTGECLIGWIGIDENSSSFTALGNTVNVVSRMESLAEGNQIIISERTANLVRDLFVIEKVGTSNLAFEKKAGDGEKFNFYEVKKRRKN